MGGDCRELIRQAPRRVWGLYCIHFLSMCVPLFVKCSDNVVSQFRPVSWTVSSKTDEKFLEAEAEKNTSEIRTTRHTSHPWQKAYPTHNEHLGNSLLC